MYESNKQKTNYSSYLLIGRIGYGLKFLIFHEIVNCLVGYLAEQVCEYVPAFFVFALEAAHCAKIPVKNNSSHQLASSSFFFNFAPKY